MSLVESCSRRLRVEHDQVGKTSGRKRLRFCAVGRGDDVVTGATKTERHKSADVLFVVGNEHERCSSVRHPRSPSRMALATACVLVVADSRLRTF